MERLIIIVELKHFFFPFQAKSDLILEDDVKPVAKMLTTQIESLLRERDERKISNGK